MQEKYNPVTLVACSINNMFVMGVRLGRKIIACHRNFFLNSGLLSAVVNRKPLAEA